ncbi:hypothetical protein SCMU_00220 [Sinomonas cyclohexanicum]|uniref:TIGR04255 family protein n=1 Tax=Sinomonas cyclohexanicum TaxID=322009 RepID=A0ABM7PPQ6_SINCY|nr:TIGR04255 family protein [Corynebacterium cyclohexanicum]BCT74180.1 hypothetical protein SCMU_00220 [Corynebacterium cyclohexanicum]
MTDRDRFRPFTGDTSKKVRLQSNPLALVLCQIRWPEFGHLQTDLRSIALSFGAALPDYPIFEEVREMAYQITPEGVQQHPGDTLFHWTSVDRKWHVMLSRRFVSLFATTYEEFDELACRLQDLLENVAVHVKIPLVERVGVRYVNRLSNPDVLSDLGGYVRPEVLGYASLAPVSRDVVVTSSTNQVQYAIGDIGLRVRSGVLPANETVDPAVSPLPSPSWVLDLDAFSEEMILFDPKAIIQVAGKLSDTAYDYFKLVITEGFVSAFGGAG